MTTGGKILNRTDFDTKEVRVGKMKFEGKSVITTGMHSKFPLK